MKYFKEYNTYHGHDCVTNYYRVYSNDEFEYYIRSTNKWEKYRDKIDGWKLYVERYKDLGWVFREISEAELFMRLL